MKILWVKSIDWKYEKEWRIINVEWNKLHKIEWKVKEVIFGARMSENDKELIKKIFKNKNISFFQAEIHKSKYKINIKKI